MLNLAALGRQAAVLRLIIKPPFTSMRRFTVASSVPAQTPTASAHDHSQHPSILTAEKYDQRDKFWQRVPFWRDVSTEDFLSWAWNRNNVIEHHTRSRPEKLKKSLEAVLPSSVANGAEMQTRDDFIDDIFQGLAAASMSLRIMPHTFSRINWQDPRNDPIFRQFIPLKSAMLPDHPKLCLDSLHEHKDSPVECLVHRYPDKALFLPVSVCPTYCTFCTRSYKVGADTQEVSKQSMAPTMKRWEESFQYGKHTLELRDIVVSGGDAYYLTPKHLAYVGERWLELDNIKKIRYASKGLAVAPNRFLDPNDEWMNALIYIHKKALKMGKRMALHTHFNHPNEISWITHEAARRLVEAGVTIRNQSVLLRGVNDDVETMSKLIRMLADDLRIQPYYVYQCDMVPKVEHLRTPLRTILDLQKQLRGTIAGFDTPHYVVDLPEGGGKRLACDYESYDRVTGVGRWVAPAVKGRDKEDKVYEYYDPVELTNGSNE